MRKLSSIVIVALAMLSCSTTYQFIQVGKLVSDNVQMNDNGKFEYKHSDLTITYNFWNYGGDVSFVITNNSDKDIYLLMDNCYFIKNGVAYDYYKNRTYIVHESTSHSATVSSSASVSASKQSYDFLVLDESKGYSASRSTSGAVSAGRQSGYSIETPENKTVCVPAHSSKYFSEFHISNLSYRQCGFARDTNTKEGEKIQFNNAAESPQSIENRLVFNINGTIVPIVNTFYVSEYINIGDYEGYAFVSSYEKDCKGKNIYPSIRHYIHKAGNCFYTTYQCKFGKDNDRSK